VQAAKNELKYYFHLKNLRQPLLFLNDADLLKTDCYSPASFSRSSAILALCSAFTAFFSASLACSSAAFFSSY